MTVENLNEKLKKANDITKLSKTFNEINNTLDKVCKSMAQSIFDYKFSTFLYNEYIIKNKTKYEIANEIGIHESNVFYYIKKYKLKKNNAARQYKMLQTMKKTCNSKYNVNHPGELQSAHRKRINNILDKTHGDYSKNYYKKLNRTVETIQKMKKAQQCRRQNEKEGDINE